MGGERADTQDVATRCEEEAAGARDPLRYTEHLGSVECVPYRTSENIMIVVHS